jgi:hypothetical protein
MSSRTLSATDHLVADAFASELSAKDDEIERLSVELRSAIKESILRADRLTTARADAIKECANLARAMAAGETYETGRQKAINIVAALESLLNKKEHGNND